MLRWSADQSTTIQHWQLRDLVHAHGEQDLFFVRDNRTLQLDVAAGSVRACPPHAESCAHACLGTWHAVRREHAFVPNDGSCIWVQSTVLQGGMIEMKRPSLPMQRCCAP